MTLRICIGEFDVEVWSCDRGGNVSFDVKPRTGMKVFWTRVVKKQTLASWFRLPLHLQRVQLIALTLRLTTRESVQRQRCSLRIPFPDMAYIPLG